MTEKLFQYLWKNSLFRPENLETTTGEKVTVVFPGRQNNHAGPDFLEGKVKIGSTVWVGNIELHLKASDWKHHAHDRDAAYKNIILHVVLENDEQENAGNFPTLVLKSHLLSDPVHRFQRLMEKEDPIACSEQIALFPRIKMQSWMTRLLAERWEEKLKEWEDLWELSGRDWHQLLYYRMAANFGFHTNREPFLQLALSLPLTVLARHRNNLMQIEALLFGQAGLLAVSMEEEDAYFLQLKKEYHFLRRKYELTPIPAFHWKFMRMRPANFPTIRIAQFAVLIHRSLDLFSKMMDVTSKEDILPLLDAEAGVYWENHYRFCVTANEKSVKRLGREAVYNLIINTIAPMQFLYAHLQGVENLVEKSTGLLQSLPPEKNKILKEWDAVGVQPGNAAESQALLQLFTRYCSEKKCLDCAVGNYLIKDSGLDSKVI